MVWAVLAVAGLNRFCLAGGLHVGVAVVDITPPVGFRTGGGYGEVVSTAVDDPLFAKAIVLRQTETTVALVICDLLSVPPDLTRQAQQLCHKECGITPQNVIIAATHNHGSPEYWGSLRDLAHNAAIAEHGHDPHEPVDYQSQLVQACAQSVTDAVDNLQPSVIQFAVGRQDGLAFNRRFHMKDGSVRFNPGMGNPDILRPAGPVDPDLPVILFQAVDSDSTAIASLTTFAMHTAVHGGTTFSADFPAVMQRVLQKKFGAGFVSVFAEGTAGDINHIDVSNSRPLRGRAEVERIGHTLAGSVHKTLANAKELNNTDLAIVSQTGFARFQPVSEARFRESMLQLQHQKTMRLPFLTTVAAWRDCHRWRYTEMYPDGLKPLLVQGIRLNQDTAIVTLPHEVFVELGMAIRATSPFRNTIVISLAGDVDFYIPTRRAFEEGSYEVTTCPLDAGCGEILFDTARSVLKQLKSE